MQTQRPAYEEIEELLGEMKPPRVALVEQRVGSLVDLAESARETVWSVRSLYGSVRTGSLL